MPRAIALTFSCVALALGAAACGGGSASGGDADPASLAPADASIYMESVVQPEGERRDDALAAAGKLMRTDDPGAKLRGWIDDALAEDGGGMTWEKDFAPWVGEEVGFWMSGVADAQPTLAAALATTDREAAEAAIQKIKESEEDAVYTDRTHAGVKYSVEQEDGVAVGMVDDFVVVGTEPGFKRAVDLREGGETLADSDRYRNAVENVEDDALGFYYADMGSMVDAAANADPETAQELEQIQRFFPLDKLGPVTAAFSADGDGVSLDYALTDVPEGPVRQLAELSAGSESELLGDLPEDAWGAYAVPNLGESAEELFNSFAGAIGAAAISAQVKEATGLELQRDVFSWVGDAAVFVRGTTEAELGAALVLESTDDGRAEAAFGKLIGVIAKQDGTTPEPVQLEGAATAFRFPVPDAQQALFIARGEGRVIAAYGESAAVAALDADGGFSESPLYEDATDFVGDDFEPVFLLSVGDAIKLADAMGATDADFDEARPYLEALGTVVGGGKIDGDRLESRFGVTLK